MAIWGVLRLIGKLLSVDDCMAERIRIGFAPACVKFDLSQSLRSGVLIKGSEGPFGRGSCVRTLMAFASGADASISWRGHARL